MPASRYLTWYIPGVPTSKTAPQGPVFYIDGDSEPTDVRIYAVTPPASDMLIDILDDGVSIFNNRDTEEGENVKQNRPLNTTIILPAKENFEVDAEDLIGETITEGSWVSLIIPESCGARDITVTLELVQLEESDTESEESE